VLTSPNSTYNDIRRVRFKDITMRRISPQGGTNHAIWLDGAEYTYDNPVDGGILFIESDFRGGIYMTETYINKGANGPRGAALTRNTRFDTIGVDAYKNPLLAINTEIRTIGQLGVDGAHEDLIQFQGAADRDNIIIYGLKAMENIRAQGLFANPKSGFGMNNVAMINWLVRPETNIAQYNAAGNHVLLWHLTFLDRDWRSVDDNNPFNIRNGSIRNCVFHRYGGAIGEFRDVSNNHFLTGSGHGSNYTTGGTASSFFDSNYVPISSVLLNRVQSDDIVTAADINGRPIDGATADAIGAVQPQ